MDSFTITKEDGEIIKTTTKTTMICPRRQGLRISTKAGDTIPYIAPEKQPIIFPAGTTLYFTSVELLPIDVSVLEVN